MSSQNWEKWAAPEARLSLSHNSLAIHITWSADYVLLFRRGDEGGWSLDPDEETPRAPKRLGGQASFFLAGFFAGTSSSAFFIARA